MPDLSLSQAAILLVGLLIAGAGVAGLAPLLIRKSPSGGRLRIDESLNPALHSTAAFLRPMPPFVMAGVATPARPASVAIAPHVRRSELPVAVPEVAAAEELLAQLFTIRMTVSELATELQELRDSYQGAEGESLEDFDAIDDVEDDLSDMDDDPEEAPEAQPDAKLRETA